MRGLLIAAFAVAVFAASGVAGDQHARVTGEGWREIGWPFPRDGWPAGRAFRCDTEVCGGEVEVYVRPKIGFCNCDTGVADDDEVDRVADMPGRLRTYDLHLTGGVRHTAIGIAVSRGCDLMVAVAQGTGAAPEVQRVALDFLASRDIARWMTKAMDGG